MMNLTGGDPGGSKMSLRLSLRGLQAKLNRPPSCLTQQGRDLATVILGKQIRVRGGFGRENKGAKFGAKFLKKPTELLNTLNSVCNIRHISSSSRPRHISLSPLTKNRPCKLVTSAVLVVGTSSSVAPSVLAFSLLSVTLASITLDAHAAHLAKVAVALTLVLSVPI